MNERSVSGSGTLRSYTGEAASPQLANTLLAFFLWLNLALLTGVGGIASKDATGLGLFASTGVLCLSLSALLCGLFGREKTDFRVPSMCCYVVLAFLPF